MSSVRVFGCVGPVVASTGAYSVLPTANRQLLAALVAVGPDGQPHDRLAEVVWPAGPPRTWHAALRLNASRLREQVPGLPVLSSGGRFRLACPADAVDAWWLDDLIRSDRLPSEPDLLRALAGRPYDDVKSGPTFDDARHVAEFQQRRLIDRFRTVGARAIRDETSDSLYGFAVREYADTGIVGQVVTILRTADREAEAEQLLQTVAARHRSDLGWVPDELSDLFQVAAASSVAGNSVAAVSSAVRRHPALDAADATPLVGRSDLVASLAAPTSCLLLGRSGSGRTGVIAAATGELDEQSRRYVYITPAGAGSPSLAPVLVAVPHLASLPAATTDEAIRSHWHQLMTYSGGEPVHFFVDDANLLDPATLEVVHLLAQASLNHASIAVTIVADIDDATSTWLAVRHHLEHLGVPTLELGGFERCAVASLVRSRFPEASACAVNGLVDDLLAATEGQPDFLLDLLNATDPMTLQLPDRPLAIDRSSPLLAGLEGELRTVAVGAAVLGTGASAGAFCLDALVAVMTVEKTALGKAAVEQAIMELWKRELVDELGDGRFRFRDLRLRSALLGSVPRRCRATLHLRALELPADLHCWAEHAYLALPCGDASVTITLLAASAELHTEELRWQSVARQCERIDALLGDETGADVLSMWAVALDALGFDRSSPSVS